MSIRTLLIWIIIAGILGAGVLLTRAQQDKHRATQPTAINRHLEFDPAQVRALEIRTPTKRQTLELRDDLSNQWIVRWTQNQLDRAMPAQSVKVRSGLRALSTTKVLNTENSQTIESDHKLIIHTKDSKTIHLIFNQTSSGGYTPITIEYRDQQGIANKVWNGRVEKGISDAFIDTGLLPWRSQDLFDIPNSSIRSMNLRAGSQSVSLNRSSTGWKLSQPHSIAGNALACDTLVKSITSFEAISIIDSDESNSITGLDQPIASLSVETNIGNYTLTIGSQADLQAQSVYAKIQTPIFESIITMETKELAKLTAAPTAYIHKSPTALPGSAFDQIQIIGRDQRSRILAIRDSDAWLINDKPADSLNKDAFDRLLMLMTSTQAQHLDVYTTADLPKPIGSIKLSDEIGNTLEHYSIAAQSSQSGMQILFIKELDDTRSIVWAILSQDASATVAWFTAAASTRIP